VELRNGQSRIGNEKNRRWRDGQKCRYNCDRSHLEMLTAATDVRLRTLLTRQLAAGLRGRHVFRATLRTHLAAAFFFVRAKQLLRHKTRKSWHSEQRQQRRDTKQSDSQLHRQ
jgi:hypothetical protein